MNDFTKDELKIIKDAIYGMTLNSAEEVMLREKIKSMIDDYCEHEFYSHEGVYSILKCEKCDAEAYL